jgi:hypothetical protein
VKKITADLSPTYRRYIAHIYGRTGERQILGKISTVTADATIRKNYDSSRLHIADRSATDLRQICDSLPTVFWQKMGIFTADFRTFYEKLRQAQKIVFPYFTIFENLGT